MNPKEMFDLANKAMPSMDLDEIKKRINIAMTNEANRGFYSLNVNTALISELKNHNTNVFVRVLGDLISYYRSLEFVVRDYSESGYFQINWDLNDSLYKKKLKGGLSIT